ncbi:hypothetical protein E9228_001524 [Curtobacterium flaccumfaciens]|uniref:Alkaline shock response membrane anchor protein AmaP n=1 Tax=Curtobacterium salicis TaxID=1779862 RepID=A0ABX0T9L9_9MICO|nr:hypothetical protein [Curtobacterium sp. WW7]NII40888.1 hypothetical protein [Curtobacterium sp. WW7]
MNGTNRSLGRAVLVLVGLLFLALGAAVVLVQTLPAAADVWHTAADRALGGLRSGAADTSAWWWALGGAVVLGVLALLVLGSIGGGRTGTVLQDDGPEGGVPGQVRIEAAAVEHALSTAVATLPQVASLAVDVRRVRGQVAVRIIVRTRRGAPPREVVERVEEVVRDLDALLGEQLPVLLRIVRGGSSRPDRVR